MTSVEMEKTYSATKITATIDIVLPYTEMGTKHQKSQKIQKNSNLNKGEGGSLVAILDPLCGGHRELLVVAYWNYSFSGR